MSREGRLRMAIRSETGAVLTTRPMHSMRRDGLKRGIVTLCIGGGQGSRPRT
jgi:acetyl-CoA acetyltransferase